MIRGTHKQIVVLQELENSMFEQAIFILKPDALKGYKKNPDEVVREARKVVEHYAERNGIAKTITKPIKTATVLQKKKRRLLLCAFCFFFLMAFALLFYHYVL